MLSSRAEQGDRTVHIGLSDAFGGTPARDAAFIQEYATRAESLGFESLWVPEHVVFFDRYDSRYPYNESGVLDLGSDPGVFDPFLALTVAAVATTELKLGTSVLLIGERNPLITARESATLDQISAGRFLLGVGVGWSQEEYVALGVPWERRGDRCDEYIQVMKEVWTAARGSFHGEFCDFDDVIAVPKPVQHPHLPVLVGGNTPPALRRAARWGDGWFGWNLTVDQLQATIETLEELLAANGRSRDGFVLQTGLFHGGDGDGLNDYMQACARLGLDRLVLGFPVSRRTFSTQLEHYAGLLALSA
jgi:probable F420-dependent oxidoreductase